MVKKKLSFITGVLVTATMLSNAVAGVYPSSDMPVPAGFKESPFVETNPEIVPTEAEKELGFVVFNRPITETVYPQSIPLVYERLSCLSAFAAPGEFEPVTFSIYPLRDLKDIKVDVSPLMFGKNLIPTENIDTRLVVYRNINYPHYTTSGIYRRMPEILEHVKFNNAAAKECQRYWLKIKVPENAVPGIYQGSINVSYKGLGKNFSIPVSFKVLSFKLLKDQSKHYTTYNWDTFRIYKNKSQKWKEDAVRTDGRAMTEYGIDTIPTIYLAYDIPSNSMTLDDNKILVINEMIKAGMHGPVPAVGIGSFYSAFRKKDGSALPKPGPHCKLTELPPEEFYPKLTEAVKNFEKIRKEKNWPEFIYVPLDEVDPSSKEFGMKVYKAFKDAGVKTYVTKDPVSADAKDYAPYVDFWCGQSFSIPYEKAVSDKKYGYWCYPNHNSNEIKIPEVMCRGGRMTYGFGFWRSGYSLLIPWIWRSYNQEYLGKGSACGNFFDENGNIVPTPYWECFREGCDDLRYLYTLETAIVQREDSKDSGCLALVKEGRALLQKIWDSINVQTKYLANNVWTPATFDFYRWQMAEMTERLLKYPASNNNIAPSVIINTDSKKCKESDFFEEQTRKGNIIEKDLGDEDFASWKSLASEGVLAVTEKFKHSGNKSLLFDLTVDYKKDGGGENGNYPVGWPRFIMSFPGKGLDMTEYNYLSLWVMVDSARDEVADDFSPFYISFLSPVRRNFFNKEIITQVEQREWVHVLLPVNEMIASKEDVAVWKRISGIQFGISESKYPDGTKIQFYVDGISLIKLKTPTISSIDTAPGLLLPATNFIVPCSVMGVNRGTMKNYLIDVKLINSTGNPVVQSSLELSETPRFVLDVSSIDVPGTYSIRCEVKEKNTGKVCSSLTKKLDIIAGPFFK